MIDYTVKEIERKLANEIQLKNHYLHTRASCSQAFGLFDNDDIIGVMLFGNPTAPTTINICGESNKKKIIELTRLWIKDDTPKNTESYFISRALKNVLKPVIIAFADPDANHVGTIYQACSFIYLGKSNRGGRVIAIKNNKIHNKTLWSEYKTAKRIREVFGADNVYYKEYNTKHRYVYINCHKKLRKEYIDSLIYDVQKYPKR
jgi:hypothetical protein